jgi:outer membrane protein insertion porin family
MRYSVRFLFSLFVLVCASAVAYGQDSLILMDYATPKDYKIGNIEVICSPQLDKTVIKTLSGLRQGEDIKVPGEDIQKAIKALWKQKLFTNISVEVDKIVGNEIFLIIRVEERPRVSKIMPPRGIKNSEWEDLKKKMDVTAGQIFTENRRKQAINVIKNFYVEKGFLNTKVSVEETIDSNNSTQVKLKFFVSKGTKVHINHINIYGVSGISETKLKGQMKETKEKVKFDVDGLFRFKKNFAHDSIHLRWYQLPGNLSPMKAYDYASRFLNLNVFKASKFKRNEYEADKDKIIEYLNSKGYRDAKIDSSFEVATDPKNMDINIYVHQGHKFYFRNFYWNGNTKYADTVLAKILNIKRGEVYNQKVLDERLFMNQSGEDISSKYMDDGYLFFSITPMEVRVENDSIDIEFRISEGAQATIREVRIIGNTKTSEKVIRRELRTLPGNKFSRTDLIRSQREIVALGYFDAQQLDVVPIPNPENGTVDIEYRVVEKPSDQLELSAGWGGRGQGIFGTLGVNFTNFSLRNIIDKKSWSPLPSGDGQRFGLRVQSNGRSFQSYNVSFTEPWLGGKKPLSLSFLFNRFRANQIDANNKIIGSYYSTSVYTGLATKLKWPDDYFVGEIGLEFQHYILKNYSGVFLFDNGRATNLNLQFTLSRDSRWQEAPTYYSSGIYVSAQAKFTLPYSLMFNSRKLDYTNPELSDADRYKWVEFHKWKFELDAYAPIYKKVVLRVNAKMSFLGLYNKDLGYAPFERVELGGDGLSNLQSGNLLGRDIISLRGYKVLTPSAGAPIYNKFFAELRVPFSLNQSATIYGLVFAEAGNYWNRIQDYRPYNLRKSVGAGIRVFLPMFGLLGFDYGIGFDRSNSELNNPNAKNIFGKYGEFRIILGQEPQ